MLVVGRAAQDAVVAGEHVHLDDGVVHQPEPERRSLDADARHRAAQGDRLELRDDARHRAFGERRVRQVEERGHAFGFDDARLAVDVEHAVEVLEIDPRLRLGRAVAEEVRRRLGEAESHARRRRGKLGLQPVFFFRVGAQ